MSNVRYIEIDSTYRDRTKFPLPGEFEVPLAQSGSKGRLDAVDPVCYSAPLTTWQSNEFVVGGGSSITVLIDAVDSLQNSVSPQIVFITAVIGTLQHLTNYYRAAVANNTTLSVRRPIVRYQYLGVTAGLDRALIELKTGYPDTFAVGNTITITDPTDLSDPLLPLVFVPAGVYGDNAYWNDYLYNESLNQYRPIIDYGDLTRLVQTGGAAIVGWLPAHVYSIRKQLPSEFGAVSGASSSIVTLWPTASTIQGYYIGDFLRITRSSLILTPPENEARRIVAYNGATQTVTVFPPFSVAVPVAATGEILGFSRDNLVPLDYNGSTVSQQQMVCYEVGLLNLVVPNSVIQAGDRGSHVAFYPYLYVELANATAPSGGMSNIIYSNNPNAVRMTFRASVNNVNNPTVTSFINIAGNSMLQTIKFKPNDNLYFRVTLPSGETFNTTQTEYYSPFLPNPLGQISAAFSIKRL